MTDNAARKTPRSRGLIRNASRLITRRFVLVGVLVSFGVTVSLLLFSVARSAERSAMRDRFHLLVHERTASIQNELDAATSLMKSVRSLYLSSEEVTAGEFAEFVLPLINEHPGLWQAVEWIPRVLRSEKERYERQMRVAGHGEFRLTEIGADGQLVPAGERREYFPVCYVQPYEGQSRRALGFDLASEPRRLEALLRARDAGHPIASAIVSLVQGDGEGRDLLIYLPVYHRGADTSTLAGRREGLQGFVLGVFRVEHLLQHGLMTVEPADIPLAVYAGPVGGGDAGLIYRDGRFEQARNGSGKMIQTTLLRLPGRQWSVVSAAGPGFFEAHSRWFPWAILLGGLGLTALCGVFTSDILRRARQKALLARDLSVSNRALRRTQQRLIGIVETEDEAICRWRPDTTLTFVNEGYCKAFGKTRGELIGIRWIEMVPKKDRPEIRARIDQQMSDPGRSVTEHHVMLPDGSVHYQQWIDRAMLDGDGNVFEFQSIGRDTTDRRLAEEALRESEQRYRTILEHVNDGFVLHDLNGKILDVNDRLCAMVGHTREEMLSSTVARLPAELAPHKVDRMLEILRTDGELLFDADFARKDGSILPVSVSASLLSAEGDGTAQGFIRDITERKQAEEELRISRHRYREMVENISDAIFSMDCDGVFTYVSPVITRISGFRPDEQVGHYFGDFIHPEDLEGVQQAFVDCLAGEVEGHHFRMLNKDGETLHIRTSARPRYRNGEVAGITGTLTDMTEVRRMEELFRQAQKMEAIGQLAGGLSHDYRNQLTVVRGYAEMLLESELSEHDERHALQEILSAVDRSSVLSNELLAFSRKQVLHPETVDLSGTVSSMSRSLMRVIGEDVKLMIADSDQPARAFVDPTHFQQAMINLVVNARDAMPDGGQLTVEVSRADLDAEFCTQHPDASPGPHAVVAVSDTGCGMDRATIERVCEPFFTTKPVGEGTGLGLSMVYGFVKQSGGAISIYSEPGQGSTFRIYLPRAVDAEEIDSETDAREPLLRGSGTVLVVEDEQATRHVLKRVLRKCGYTVLETGEPSRALSICSEYGGRIDLLLTDVIMPGMDGIQLAERIVAARPDVPVIYMSGYTGKALERRGILREDLVRLSKPFIARELARVVHEVIEQGRVGTCASRRA